MVRSRLLVLPVVLLPFAILLACGDTTVINVYPADANAGDAPAPNADGAPVDPSDAGACEASPLGCQVVSCAAGVKTTLRGKVYDPAGANALYNVRVYIPDGPQPEVLPEIPDSTQVAGGITCGGCSPVPSALRSTVTNEKGEFVLEDVPVGSDIPVVVQIGKWRRLHHVDIEKPCAENEADDTKIRLPRNGTEGNMPQFAVTTGALDAFECILRGIGVDDGEFVPGHGGTGHVHLFKGSGGGMGPPAQDFWTDAAQMRKYDAMMLSCEGDEHNENKGTKDSMYEYLNAGGKVIATHFHYTWFKNSTQDEFKNLAVWGSGAYASEYDVNTSFPAGLAFAQWLNQTGASAVVGKITLESTTNSIKSLNPPSLAWISAPNNGAKMFTFDTPISAAPANQCGRGVFTDVHVSDTGGPASIKSCGISSGGLNAQQKALEFLFFTLSGC